MPSDCTPRTRTLTLASACALIAAAVPDAEARPKQPILIQVTQNTTGDVWEPKLRTEKGNSIVFVSDGDVLGGPAPGHREVYLYDVDTGTTTRITDTAGGESYGAARETDSKHSGRPTYVTFTSTGDFDPSVGNADGNAEIFAWIRETGEFIQLTDTTAPADNGDPYASDGGKCIVFRSSADLQNNDGSDANEPSAGFTNADGSDEVFRMAFGENDFTERVITQVSDGPAGTRSEKPVVGGFWFTRQCRSTAYQSNHDQIGNGSTGMHVYNWTKTSAILEQLSEPGNGFSFNPAISGASNFARGPFVLFESTMDPIGNGNDGLEIFRFRLFKNELLQYSFAPGDSVQPSVSDGGGWGAFASTSELIDPSRRVSGGTPPFNDDGNLEIFRYERKRKISQITRSESCENTHPTVRDNARAIAFRSTCDLVPGGNPDHLPQVFLYLNVKPKDPLMSADVCKVIDGCCNEANGCYTAIQGSKIRPPKMGIRPDFGAVAP